MSKFNLIKQKAKRIIKISKQTINLALLKTGIKFHSYGSMTDIDSRESIAKNVINIIDQEKPEVLNVLIVGSPGMQELKSIPSEYLKKLNVTSVDYSDPQTLHKLSTKLNVRKYLFKQCDAFSFLSQEEEKKYDLIINRSFLHHISKNNKKKFVDNCYRILAVKGKLFCIDWFVDNYKNENEMFSAISKYYIYRSKYTPALKNKMTTKNRDKSSYWWENMHNDSDFSGGKHATREEMEMNFISAGFNETEILDIANPKRIDNPHLWGHVMTISIK